MKRPRKLSDSVNRYLLLGSETIVGVWLKPDGFLLVERVSGSMVRPEEDVLFSILGTTTEFEEAGFEVFVRQVV